MYIRAHEPMRVRLTFDESMLLGEAQRVWFKVPPDAKVVADIMHAILDAFPVRRLCPKGILLSVDGFALPPSQSAEIVHENDLIVYASAVRPGPAVPGIPFPNCPSLPSPESSDDNSRAPSVARLR